ncbi:MAG: c-type cytochrome [Spirosomaceae bacterium]|nr:c-type cytochrome [Spirosomataceae bacterium]
MKFRNYLESIDGVAVYPLISLLIFVPFFVGLLWYVWRMDKRKVKKFGDMPLEDNTFGRTSLLTLAFLGMTTLGAVAQTETKPAGNEELMTGLIIGLLVLVVMALIVLLVQVFMLLQKINSNVSSPVAVAKEDLRGDSAPLFSARWWQRWYGFGVKLDDEQRILIKGHDYDGIHELDNRMPPWLAFLFQGTIVFAVIYGIYYHWTNLGDLPAAELEKETQVVEAQKAAFLEKAAAKINESSVTLLTDAKTIEEGKAIFTASCAACHAADGGGGVGPNLTDEHWLHGGGVKDIFKTIKYGVPEKGMISWEKQLNPLKMQQVASYIISLKGSKPANPKEPQGEIYQEKAVADSTVAMK